MDGYSGIKQGLWALMALALTLFVHDADYREQVESMTTTKMQRPQMETGNGH